jgi:hypothetical protein
MMMNSVPANHPYRHPAPQSCLRMESHSHHEPMRGGAESCPPHLLIET